MPSDPRGWLEFVDAPTGADVNRFTVGMSHFHRSDLMMASVPPDLLPEVRFILLSLARVKSGRDFAGGSLYAEKLVSKFQPCLHRASFLNIRPVDERQHSLLLVVDPGTTGGLPIRLMACHLIARADRCRNPVAAEGLFKRAIQIFPGNEPDSRDIAWSGGHKGIDPEDDNENNCLAYYGLANALGDQGSAALALEQMEIAVKKSPRWARANQKRIREAISPRAQQGIVDPLARFWLDKEIP